MVFQACSVFCVLFGLFLAFPDSSNQSALRAGCSVSINGGLASPQALVLRPDGSPDGFGFFLPGPSGSILLDAGQEVRLACPGDANYLNPLGVGVQEVTATCVSERTFSLPSGQTYYFNQLACKSYPVHSAVESTETCGDGHTVIDIGFDVAGQLFKLIEICFDKSNYNSLYSKFDLVSEIRWFESGFPRPEFTDTGFFEGLDPDNLYKRVTQRDTISRLLGSTALGDQYIDETNDYFLSKGHMTAKADFLYGAQQRATFHFINASPQWQTFNGANWNVLEQNLRDFASSGARDLVVHTGTYGITTLPNVDQVETELFMYLDVNGNTAMPVPKLFWKVAYDPLTEQGVALLGVNNPYKEKGMLDEEYFICTDICDQLTWLSWSQDDVKKGISYCCDVDELRLTIDWLPSFTVSGLLT